MAFSDTVKILFNHPLTRQNRIGALSRYVRWHIGSRIIQAPVAVRFVEDTRLLVEQGMHGATTNIWAGLGEFEDMAFLLHSLREEFLFMDIGANVGTYTVLASGVVGAKSISAEPVPNTFKNLCRNLRINDINDGVSAKNVAAGSEQGKTQMTAAMGSANRIAGTQGYDEDVQKVEVPVETVDHLIGNESGTPLILKIDAEGWEPEVLRGAESVLSRTAPTALIVELDGQAERYGFNEEEVDTSLQQKGFIPIQYDPIDRKVKKIKSKNSKGNTIYVESISFFEEKVEESEYYEVIGRSI